MFIFESLPLPLTSKEGKLHECILIDSGRKQQIQGQDGVLIVSVGSYFNSIISSLFLYCTSDLHSVYVCVYDLYINGAQYLVHHHYKVQKMCAKKCNHHGMSTFQNIDILL